MMRLALVIVGILIVSIDFRFRAIRKITVDFAVVWGIVGILLVLAGAITPLTEWIHRCFVKTEPVVFVLAIVVLIVAFQFSLVISGLQMKNQELAIEISLLKQENERILDKLEIK